MKYNDKIQDMDTFTYDLNGNRAIQESHSGGNTTTRAFIYGREDVAVEYSDDTFNTVFRQYIHGPGIDEPLAIVGEGKLNYTYYLHDGLGSVTGIVDMDGKLQGIYDYSAFGETRRDTVTIENRYRYTAREHVEDGLYYYRARHMRPDLGRFMSMDPLGMVDGTNAIRYVKNDPLKFLDPFGSNVTPVPLPTPNICGPPDDEYDPCRAKCSGGGVHFCIEQCYIWYDFPYDKYEEFAWDAGGLSFEATILCLIPPLQVPMTAVSIVSGGAALYAGGMCRKMKEKCEKLCEKPCNCR